MAAKAETAPHDVPSDSILSLFKYSHLPVHLQMQSKPFHDLASFLVSDLAGIPSCAMRTLALRQLLEAKDAGVRAFAIPESGEFVAQSLDQSVQCFKQFMPQPTCSEVEAAFTTVVEHLSTLRANAESTTALRKLLVAQALACLAKLGCASLSDYKQVCINSAFIFSSKCSTIIGMFARTAAALDTELQRGSRAEVTITMNTLMQAMIWACIAASGAFAIIVPSDS